MLKLNSTLQVPLLLENVLVIAKFKNSCARFPFENRNQL